MTIRRRPSSTSTPARRHRSRRRRQPCRHGDGSVGPPWSGEPGTAGTVAVVGAGKMGLPLAAQFASHGWQVIAVDIDAARRRRRSTPGGRTSARSRVWPSWSRRARRRAAARDARWRRGGPRGRRRRPHRPGHARRRPRIRTERCDGCRGRRPRAGPARRHAGHLRDDAARRRHARPLRAAARGGDRPARRADGDDGLFVAFSPERLYSGAALATWRPIRSSSVASDRPRPPAPPPSTTASSMPRSWRCRRPRPPSSRSSPTRPTAT